jgi:putative FmdB family regulatory protein
MPTYDYHCTNCQHKAEVSQKMSEAPLTQCPHCQCPTFKRGPGGGIGLLFQGSGFYITDYDAQRKSAPKEGGCCPCGKNATSCSS